MSGCGRAIRLAAAFQFFENTDQLGGIAFLEKKLYSLFGKLEFPQTLLDAGPEPVAFLAFGEVEICRELGKALKLDGIEVFVVSIDDLALVRRVVGHSTALLNVGRRATGARGTALAFRAAFIVGPHPEIRTALAGPVKSQAGLRKSCAFTARTLMLISVRSRVPFERREALVDAP
jgi:hypothetical protein